jgi:hypothetical protein
VPRLQWLFIEIARNREGVNNGARQHIAFTAVSKVATRAAPLPIRPAAAD